MHGADPVVGEVAEVEALVDIVDQEPRRSEFGDVAASVQRAVGPRSRDRLDQPRGGQQRVGSRNLDQLPDAAAAKVRNIDGIIGDGHDIERTVELSRRPKTVRRSGRSRPGDDRGGARLRMHHVNPIGLRAGDVKVAGSIPEAAGAGDGRSDGEGGERGHRVAGALLDLVVEGVGHPRESVGVDQVAWRVQADRPQGSVDIAGRAVSDRVGQADLVLVPRDAVGGLFDDIEIVRTAERDPSGLDQAGVQAGDPVVLQLAQGAVAGACDVELGAEKGQPGGLIDRHAGGRTVGARSAGADECLDVGEFAEVDVREVVVDDAVEDDLAVDDLVVGLVRDRQVHLLEGSLTRNETEGAGFDLNRGPGEEGVRLVARSAGIVQRGDGDLAGLGVHVHPGRPLLLRAREPARAASGRRRPIASARSSAPCEQPCARQDPRRAPPFCHAPEYGTSSPPL